MIKLKKKPLAAVVLSLCMVLSLCSCDKKDKDTTDPDDEVVSTDIDTQTTDTQTTETIVVDPSSPEALEEQKKFDEWLWEMFVEGVTSDSITLHYNLAHPENYGIEPIEPTYGDLDMGEEALAEDKAEAEEEFNELMAFDYDLLTSKQKFTYDIIYKSYELGMSSYDFYYLDEPFAYTSGIQSNLPVILSEYVFYDKDDVETYLGLLELAPEYIDALLEFEVEKSKQGYFMSSDCASEVIRQCTEYIADPEKNLLIETFNARIGDVDGITSEEIEAYKQRNHDAVINCIIPSYKKIIRNFNTLKNTGTNKLGLCYLDGGKDYYKYLLAKKVGTDKTPEEVIEMLDNAISDVMSEYSTVAMSNYDAYMQYFEDMENGKLYKEINLKDTIEFYKEATQDRFPAIPEISYSVSPVHESLQNIVSPAFYMTPPMDGYTQNTIHTNISGDDTSSLWSTLAHEGIPGHMYQFVYFLSSDPIPARVLLDFTGYQEGWATYVEQMSFEYYTGYAHKSYASFEAINNKLSLLVSSRIEIGVNYEGWTLEETQNYLSTNGFNPDVAKDIMTYVIAEPVNYQMYCTGWLSFLELKEKAQTELGGAFNEKEFHKVILDAGPCQFFLLEEKVDEYIKANK